MSQAADNPSSTKPYLLRALYEWCTDNGYTPYLAVQVDGQVRVPREHVKNGEIVLNISFGATSALKIGNLDITFKARFGGVARDILVPVSHVTAIYARENGQGMAFPAPDVEGEEAAPAPAPEPGGRLHAVPDAATAPDAAATPPEPPPEAPPPPRGGHLKRVK
jgi:stringent starvation protein B